MRNRLQRSLAGGPVEANFRVISAQKTWEGRLICVQTHKRSAAAGVAFGGSLLRSAAVTLAASCLKKAARETEAV